MTTTDHPTPTTQAHLADLGIWVEQRGEGPDVLLIGGLGDSVEAWQAQLDGLPGSYRLTAFDNRGAGRSPLPDGRLSVAGMADDAAAVLRALDIANAHVAGFSGCSVIAQELALRHPDLVRSLVLVSTWGRPDVYAHSVMRAVAWMAQHAPSERAFLEAFFLWIYTRRAHESGLVEQIIEEALAFPYAATPEVIQKTLDAFQVHETLDRLPAVTAPTLVLSGGQDLIIPPLYGRAVADAIPGAVFEVWEEEAHQPFQEVPEAFNARVDLFWREVEGRRS
jgi:pimeloyl-ACP methyl ester carboxylesterase